MVSEIIKYVTGALLVTMAFLYVKGNEGIIAEIKKIKNIVFIVSLASLYVLTSVFYWHRGIGIGFFCVLLLLATSVYLDMESKEIPNPLLLAFGAVGVVLLPVNPMVGLKDGLIGFGAFGAIFVLLSMISKGNFGMGDAKLIAVVALMVGWRMMTTVIIVALVVLVIAGIALLAFRVKKGKDRIPFSPFLLAAALFCILL